MNPQSTCKTCHKTKPIEDFPKSSVIKGVLYRRTQCRTCWNAFKRIHQKTYYHTERGKRAAKNANLYKYGLTLEDYEQLEADQNHVCAICRKPRSTKRCPRLFVDHDHKTGKIRGLLCHHCNAAIGHMMDSPETLRRAAQYLEETM